MQKIILTTWHGYLLLIFTISGSLLFLNCEQRPRLPVARAENIVDRHHGVEVSDPYRWLENWNDPAVRAWSDQQNAYARNYLDNLPGVTRIRERVREIYTFASPNYYYLTWRGEKLFAMKHHPPLNQPLLVCMNSPGMPESEKIIFNLNDLAIEGSVAIDWYVPSPDGKLVALSISCGGTEDGDLWIYETDTGKKVYEEIPRVNRGTAGGDLAWTRDSKGFFYTRYPAPGERAEEDLNFFQEVWYHQLGTPVEKDFYVIGEEFPRIVEIRLELDPASGRLLVTTQYGDGGIFAHYLVEPGGKWKQVTSYEDQITEMRFGPDQSLIAVSRKDSPRGKILQMSASQPELNKARIVVSEMEGSIITKFGGGSNVIPFQKYLLLTYQIGGPSELKIFAYDGKLIATPQILPLSTIHEIVMMDNDSFLFSNSSYIEPKTWYMYRISTGQSDRLAISSESPVDYSDTEVIRDFAVSEDGTRIPVNIIRLKSTKLDGSNPALLYAYGGYGISQTPGFSSLRRVWIEQGGVYAVANLRGGGEYGEEWHQAGMLTRKQNVFDDFAAVMTYLIDQGYTTPDKLAINGGSNGGLLMGAIITQHPDRFKATVSTVGIYDMVRVELSPNGSFNVTEFGTVKDPEQFRALYAYSPYHRVQDSTAYPATLFMTGANDPRVDPMQSRKMTARMQAATSSQVPILLRTSSGTGHGSGTPLDDRIDEQVDKHAFLFYQLGINYQPVNP